MTPPDLGTRTVRCPQCNQRLTVHFGPTDEPEDLVGWIDPHPCPMWQSLNAADAPQASEPGASAVTTSLPDEAAA